MDGGAAFLQEKLDQLLRLAAEEGDEAECRELLNAGARFNSFSPDDEKEMTAFSLATTAGHEAVCRLFLKRGARVTHKSKAVYLAAVAGHGNICKLLIDSLREDDGLGKQVYLNKNTFALVKAAGEGHVAACRLLLDAGAAVDSAEDQAGCSALYMAACNGHVAVCQLLLDEGADVTRASDVGEATALVGAAYNGHVAVCELLLERGADVGQEDGGAKTALYVAAGAGKKEVCRLILDNTAGYEGEEERHFITLSLTAAAENGHARVCKVLMDGGAGYRDALREAVKQKRFEAVQAIVLHERFDPEDVNVVQCDGQFLRTVMQGLYELRQWKMIPDSVQELLIQLGHAAAPHVARLTNKK